MKTISPHKYFLRRSSFGLFFLFAFALSSCKHDAGGDGEDEDVQSITPVTISNVAFGPITENLELNAVSAFQKKISVKATTTGYIEDVNVNLGSTVGSDEILFTIKTKEAAALNNAGIDSLVKFSGVIKIKSQKSGILTTLSHQKGDFVQEGDELAVISDRTSLVFLLQVPFEMNRFVKVGKDCEIILPGDSVIQGKITGTLPEVDPASQTQQYVVKANTSQSLPENLIAKVRVVKSVKEKTTLVPNDALLSDETQTEFWVMKLMNDSTAVKTIVQPGIKSGDQTEILEPAFTDTDKIIVKGNYGLADTAKVVITGKE